MLPNPERADVELVAGQRLRWLGLPGQYDPEAVIVIGSATALMQVNAVVERDDGSCHLVTIGAADLVATVERGWLRPVASDDLSPDRVVAETS